MCYELGHELMGIVLAHKTCSDPLFEMVFKGPQLHMLCSGPRTEAVVPTPAPQHSDGEPDGVYQERPQAVPEEDHRPPGQAFAGTVGGGE